MSPHTDHERRDFTGFLHHGKRTRAAELRFAALIIVWALLHSGALYLLRGAIVTGPAAWAVALMPTLFAFVPLWAYYRFIQRADELVRKIQLESIGFGFTVGLLYAFARMTLEKAELLATASAGDVGVVMLFAWGFAQIVGAWRYR